MAIVSLKKLVMPDDEERGGFLFVDKRSGMSSFDVVREARRQLGVRRIGHSGTLDPLATGLMVLAVGRATKFLEYLLGLPKVYEVTATFGSVSDTYDSEGELSLVSDSVVLAEDNVLKVIGEKFLGEIDQVPPKYSALKIKGKRACDLMRAGEEVKMKTRRVNVSSFEVLSLEGGVGRFRVACSKGTYVRSLVHDLGQEFGVGAYVSELRRLSIGPFDISECSSELKDFSVLQRVFPAVEVDDLQFMKMKNGQKVFMESFSGERSVALFGGKVVGVVECG